MHDEEQGEPDSDPELPAWNRTGDEGGRRSLFSSRPSDPPENPEPPQPPPFPDSAGPILVPPAIPPEARQPSPFDALPPVEPAGAEPERPDFTDKVTVPRESLAPPISPFDLQPDPVSLGDPGELRSALGSSTTSTGLPAPDSDTRSAGSSLLGTSWSTDPPAKAKTSEEPLSLDSLLGPASISEPEPKPDAKAPVVDRTAPSRPLTAILGWLFGVAVLGALWFLGTDGDDPLFADLLIASPGDSWDRLRDVVDDGSLVDAVVPTLTHIGLALATGGLAGLAVGAAGGAYPLLRDVFRPFISAFRLLSPVLLVFGIVARWGAGGVTDWLPAALGVFAIISWTTTSALADERRGVSVNAVERVVVGLRTSLPLAWALVFASEIITGSEGIGSEVLQAARASDAPTLTVHLLTALALALVAEGVLRTVERSVQV